MRWGPKVLRNLQVTRHLNAEYGTEFCKEHGLPVLSGIVPGVMAQTGMETAEILSGIVRETKPDLLIVVDALAARSIRRLGTTIQLTDTGDSSWLRSRKPPAQPDEGKPGSPGSGSGGADGRERGGYCVRYGGHHDTDIKKRTGQRQGLARYMEDLGGRAVSSDPGTSDTGIRKSLCDTAGYR